MTDETGAGRAFDGQRVLVTGATSGVGFEIARALVAGGAELVLPARDPARATNAADALRAFVPDARIEPRELDLARLDTVRSLAAALVAEGRSLEALVLNAGVALVGDPVRHVTVDGYELHFQTNFLGHAALVLGLLPLLQASATRIVVQGSVISAVRGVQWDDLQSERRYSALRAYGSSKTALGGFALELGRREGLKVALSHPGIVPATAIAPGVRARVWPGVREYFVGRIGNRPATAAQPALAALEAPAAGPVSYGPAGWLQIAGPARPRAPFRRLVDAAEAARVWELAIELLAAGQNAPGDPA